MGWGEKRIEGRRRKRSFWIKKGEKKRKGPEFEKDLIEKCGEKKRKGRFDLEKYRSFWIRKWPWKEEKRIEGNRSFSVRKRLRREEVLLDYKKAMNRQEWRVEEKRSLWIIRRPWKAKDRGEKRRRSFKLEKDWEEKRIGPFDLEKDEESFSWAVYSIAMLLSVSARQ